MAKDLVEFNGKKGVWRTISGRKVFIAEGQSLKDAMRTSGKFREKPIRNEKSLKTAGFLAELLWRCYSSPVVLLP